MREHLNCCREPTRIPYMFRRISTAILLFFAFLQCLAPLLHAHYSGVSAAVGVHVHDLPDWNGDNPAQGTHFQSLTADEAPSVGIENSLKDSGSVLSVLGGAMVFWLLWSFLPLVVGILRDPEHPRDAFLFPPVLAPPLSFS